MPTAVKTLHAFASLHNMYHEWFMVPCLWWGECSLLQFFLRVVLEKSPEKYFASPITSLFALRLTKTKVRGSMKQQFNHHLFSLLLERETSKFTGLELSTVTC